MMRGQGDESWRCWGYQGGGVLGLAGMAHEGLLWWGKCKQHYPWLRAGIQLGELW